MAGSDQRAYISQPLIRGPDHYELNGQAEFENWPECYWPPISKGCWNCGQRHDHRICPSPFRRIFCYLCGWPKVTVDFCRRPSCRLTRAKRIFERNSHEQNTLSPMIKDPQIQVIIPIDTSKASTSSVKDVP